MISKVFQISEEDVERGSTMEPEDIGKWAFLVNGGYQIYDTKYRAQKAWRDATYKSAPEECLECGRYTTDPSGLCKQCWIDMHGEDRE